MSCFEIQMRGTRTKRFFCVAILSALICSGCSDSEPMTIEEGKHLKYYVTLGNVDFDIPVLHVYSNNYITPVPRGLHKPLESRIDVNNRRKVDTIWFRASLPDMEPLNEVNFSKFGTPGFGKHVKVYMKDFPVKQSLFFEHGFPKLIPLPASPAAPNMLRYRDPEWSNREVYLNGTKPAEDLIRIYCIDPEHDPHTRCHLRRTYHGKFDIELAFDLEYLPQWQEIDQKMLSLLDSFVESARISTNKS